MMRLVFLFCAEERELLLLADPGLRPELRRLHAQRATAGTGRPARRRIPRPPLRRLVPAACGFRAVYGGCSTTTFKFRPTAAVCSTPTASRSSKAASWEPRGETPKPSRCRSTIARCCTCSKRCKCCKSRCRAADQRKLAGSASGRSTSSRSATSTRACSTTPPSVPPSRSWAWRAHGTRSRKSRWPSWRSSWPRAEADLVKFLKEETGRSENALKKALKAELDDQDVSRFRTACQSDEALWKRVQPFAGLVRHDNFGYPVVIPKGSVFVTAGPTGAQRHALHAQEPDRTHRAVHAGAAGLRRPGRGLAEGANGSSRSAKELLDLKICDMACGSGAFLVQACRTGGAVAGSVGRQHKQGEPSNTPGITPEGDTLDRQGE